VLKHPLGHLVTELNPNFKPPKKPFKRIRYEEAIQWLKDHDYKVCGLNRVAVLAKNRFFPFSTKTYQVVFCSFWF
jgi:aspartyl/asparaginyl-tRNA synthetase